MIFELKFKEKREWAQAKSQLHLLQSYEKEYGADLHDIEEVTHVSEEESKNIMLKNTEYDEDNPNDMPEEISLFDMAVGDDFVIIGTTDW